MSRLLVIPEKTVHFILERNAKLREVLEERMRFLDRELQRQKKLAERRKLPAMLDLESKAEFGEKIIKRFACGRAGRGDGLRRGLPRDDLQALRHRA